MYTYVLLLGAFLFCMSHPVSTLGGLFFFTLNFTTMIYLHAAGWIIRATLNFLFTLYHELWHWLAIWIIMPFSSKTNAPWLVITRYPSVKVVDNILWTYETGAAVHHRVSDDYDGSTEDYLISLAPIVGCMLLFWLFPPYMWIILVYHFHTIVPSMSDMKVLYEKRSIQTVAPCNQESSQNTEEIPEEKLGL